MPSKKMKALLKIIKWVLIILLSSTALLSIGLRIALPKLETASLPIKQWMQSASNFEVQYASIKSELHFFTPSLQVQELRLTTPEQGEVLKVQNIDLHIDLLSSLLHAEFIFSHFTIDGLKLDLTKIPRKKNSPSITLSEQLERLFLVELHNFSIRDSSVLLPTPKDQTETVDIEYLRGKNALGHHQLQGMLSLRSDRLNKIELTADFKERAGLSTLDGDFYFKVDNLSSIDWLTPFVDSKISLSQASLSGALWLQMKKGAVQSVRIQPKDSFLAWRLKQISMLSDEHNQAVSIEQGDIYLWRNNQGDWRGITHNLSLSANNQRWSDLALKLSYSANDWQLNLSQIDLQLLMSIRELISLPDSFAQALTELNPKGYIQDLRLAQNKGEAIAYSAMVRDFSFELWNYLPKTRNLSLNIAGFGSVGKANLALSTTALPYGRFFQAPLEIEQANIDLFWHEGKEGFQIWSENLSASTPHLGVKSEFLLDIPLNGSPWLSLYAEASLSNAGQTWRYLPLPALDPALTTFLTQSIRAGEANTAQILWNGKLSDFPYQEHQGVFQAFVPLRNAEFRFDTRWPSITELDLNLLFENDALHLDASTMRFLEAKGHALTGKLDFSSDEPLRLQAKIEATGKQLHQYMLASPLIDSVGAALTHINVDGKVQGDLSLAIPFDEKPVDVEGKVKLLNNNVTISTPAIALQNAKGIVAFKNDKIWAKSLSATLLSQKLDLAFQGETTAKKYVVDIKAKGDWQVDKLKRHLKGFDLLPVTGNSPWDLNIGLALQDIGFDYNIKLDADLATVQTQLPAPFDNDSFAKGRLTVKVVGDKEDLSGQIVFPNFKYQAQVDISKSVPVVRKSRTVIGQGELSLQPLLGNIVSINLPEWNMTSWLPWIETFKQKHQEADAHSVTFQPISRINTKIGKIRTPNMIFHDLSLTVRRKKEDFHFVLDSQEATGDALWQPNKQHVTMNFEQLFIHALPKEFKETEFVRGDRSFATQSDRDLIKYLPSISLYINDFWIQGHKFGQLDMRLKKSPNKLSLTRFNLGNADAKINLKGEWSIDAKGQNHTNVDFLFSGEDSSALMERFAFKEGIQEAKFMTKGKINYQSVPWALNPSTLNGQSETLLENGFISGVGGASRILGLFSLDSIIRKLRLDFSGVFDDGLAFDRISGNVDIKQGVATTENIEMQALAGDMSIKGKVDLTQNTIDANVRFVPDLTSGLPVLTAFAAAPQTAIYVLAVTTVLSPVIDAFTQIRYQVTGNIDKPTVKEISRDRKEIKITEKMTERLRSK